MSTEEIEWSCNVVWSGAYPNPGVGIIVLEGNVYDLQKMPPLELFEEERTIQFGELKVKGFLMSFDIKSDTRYYRYIDVKNPCIEKGVIKPSIEICIVDDGSFLPLIFGNGETINFLKGELT